MRKTVALSVAFALVLLTGAYVHAQDAAPAAAPAIVPAPGATELPFVNDGANQPVLQPLSPDGVPIDEHAMVNNDEHAAEAAGEHKKAGLPQFDTSTFSRQLFWLFLIFVFMYVVFARKTLPTISSVLENRRERIASDVRAAETLKKDVERVRAEYEAAIANAQGDAQKMLMSIQTDMKRTLEARDAEFKTKADAAVDSLEAKIDTGRARVLAELNDLAANLAVDITNRIAGVKADASTARNIVDAQSGDVKAA